MPFAWAVTVSQTVFWPEPFNVSFPIGLGATAASFPDAGACSRDARVLARPT